MPRLLALHTFLTVLPTAEDTNGLLQQRQRSGCFTQTTERSTLLKNERSRQNLDPHITKNTKQDTKLSTSLGQLSAYWSNVTQS